MSATKIDFQTKLIVIENNARSRGVTEAGIARQRIGEAERAFVERMAEIEKQFDLDCWNGFKSEFSDDEIAGMVANENHRKNYKKHSSELCPIMGMVADKIVSESVRQSAQERGAK